MKKNKKYIIVLVSLISIIIMYAPLSFGIVAETFTTQIVSRGVAILLCCMQVLQYAVPILFFIVKLVMNKKKQNNKNTFKNICFYFLISVIIGLLFLGIGNLILKNTSTYGYSSKSIDYIKYNGKTIYYHR